MYPLIEITTIPIELELKVTRPHMEQVRSTAEMEITRDQGGLQIKSRPIRLNIDTFEARNSLSPTLARDIKQNAQEGQQAAYEATATYARQGQLLLTAKIGEELVTRFAEEAMTKDIKTNVGIQFLPKGGAELSWDKGEMEIRYDMDKLNFDWRIGNGDFNFVPGDIEISVSQQPDILIKYVGGPIYVPPSADPNYVPLDAKA